MSIYINIRYIKADNTGVPAIITDKGMFPSMQAFRQNFPNGRIIKHGPEGEYSSDADGGAVSDDACTIVNEPFPKGIEESVNRAIANSKKKTKPQIDAEDIENIDKGVIETPVKEAPVNKAPITIAKTFMNNGIKFKIEESKLWKLDWVSVTAKEVDMEARAMDKEKKIIPDCSIEVKVWTPVEEDENE